MGLVASSAPWDGAVRIGRTGALGGLDWIGFLLSSDTRTPHTELSFLKLRYGFVFGIGVGVLESRFGVFVVEFRYIS